MFNRFKPKFVKQYAQLGEQAINALRDYHQEVKTGKFPTTEHAFSLSDEIVAQLYDHK